MAGIPKNIETDGVESIMKEQSLLFDSITVKERNRFIDFFDKMIDMYYDIMKISNEISDIKYFHYFDEFKAVSDMNTQLSLLNKIDYLLDVKDRIKNNVNINLLIDSVIVKFGGKNESSWS